MLRATSLLVALLAYAGLAVAECGAAHEAKQGILNDQQVQATKVPAVKTAKKSPQKSVKVACAGNNCDAAHAKQMVKVSPPS
jgi:hypothetical protein